MTKDDITWQHITPQCYLLWYLLFPFRALVRWQEATGLVLWLSLVFAIR